MKLHRKMLELSTKKNGDSIWNHSSLFKQYHNQLGDVSAFLLLPAVGAEQAQTSCNMVLFYLTFLYVNCVQKALQKQIHSYREK